jgi:hypothetical protein
LLAAGVIEGDAYDEAIISLDLYTLFKLVEALSWY